MAIQTKVRVLDPHHMYTVLYYRDKLFDIQFSIVKKKNIPWII